MDIESNRDKLLKKFGKILRAHLESLGANPYKLVHWCEETPDGLTEQYIYKLCRGDASPTDKTLERLADVKQLQVTFNQLKAWRHISKYGLSGSLQVVSEAIQITELLDEDEKILLDHFVSKVQKPGGMKAFLKWFSENSPIQMDSSVIFEISDMPKKVKK